MSLPRSQYRVLPSAPSSSAVAVVAESLGKTLAALLGVVRSLLQRRREMRGVGSVADLNQHLLKDIGATALADHADGRHETLSRIWLEPGGRP
jgi:hypothetical protein